MSASGGLGVFYEALFIGTAAVCGKKVFYHHHSYAYLTKPSRFRKYLFRLFRSSLYHVLLGEDMRAIFTELYSPLHAISISNAVFIHQSPNDSHTPLRFNEESLSFLHISNLSHEKGLHRFLSLVERAQLSKPRWTFILGGPLPSNCDQTTIRRIHELENLEFVGPVSPSDKMKLYQSASFFVFPSLYKNEAEPLVVLEAMSSGCIPLVYPVGLLKEIVGLAECILPISDYFFPDNIFNCVQTILDSGINQTSLRILERFSFLNSEADVILVHLLDTLAEGSFPAITPRC
jgi:glycosyltransferase involved in cell wall biosynthesis